MLKNLRDAYDRLETERLAVFGAILFAMLLCVPFGFYAIQRPTSEIGVILSLSTPNSKFNVAPIATVRVADGSLRKIKIYPWAAHCRVGDTLHIESNRLVSRIVRQGCAKP